MRRRTPAKVRLIATPTAPPLLLLHPPKWVHAPFPNAAGRARLRNIIRFFSLVQCSSSSRRGPRRICPTLRGRAVPWTPRTAATCNKARRPHEATHSPLWVSCVLQGSILPRSHPVDLVRSPCPFLTPAHFFYWAKLYRPPHRTSCYPRPSPGHREPSVSMPSMR